MHATSCYPHQSSTAMHGPSHEHHWTRLRSSLHAAIDFLQSCEQFLHAHNWIALPWATQWQRNGNALKTPMASDPQMRSASPCSWRVQLTLTCLFIVHIG